MTRPPFEHDVNCAMHSKSKHFFFSRMLFSAQLKEGTRIVHKDIESTSFIKSFLDGSLTRQKYIIYLQNLYCIYKDLEEALRKYKVIPIPQSMMRELSLANDLKGLDGEISNIKLLPSTLSYISRINRLQPELLVAHAYVRYLGDMSGGTILASRLKQNLDIDCLSFYSFEKAANMKEDFRKSLDRIGEHLTKEQRSEIVSEGNISFKMFVNIFRDIEKG